MGHSDKRLLAFPMLAFIRINGPRERPEKAFLQIASQRASLRERRISCWATCPELLVDVPADFVQRLALFMPEHHITVYVG